MNGSMVFHFRYLHKRGAFFSFDLHPHQHFHWGPLRASYCRLRHLLTMACWGGRLMTLQLAKPNSFSLFHTARNWSSRLDAVAKSRSEVISHTTCIMHPGIKSALRTGVGSQASRTVGWLHTIQVWIWIMDGVLSCRDTSLISPKLASHPTEKIP